MTGFTFQPAVKTQARLRMAIEGGPGTGKTFTALRIARGLVSSRPALIDTEAGSASKYADLFQFDSLVLTSYEPDDYIRAIAAAEDAGYELVIIDSLSHEWQATLETVDRLKQSERNQFAAWREPKRAHNKLVEKILQSRVHVLATMRTKVEYAVENSGGRNEVKKLGMAPIQQDDVPYTFDVVMDIDLSHNGRITKSRIAALADKSIEKPGEELGKKLAAWLAEGAPAPVPTPPTEPVPPISGGNAASAVELRARAERDRTAVPLASTPDAAARQALITRCVHIWGKDVATAQKFMQDRELPKAITGWPTETLVEFEQHMTDAALAKA